jgi:hypothetical protein
VIRHLYPITPVQLGPGFVIGVERVVTKVPGHFSFATIMLQEEVLVLRSFDSSGWLVATANVSGPTVNVVVPTDGFAVIHRHN